MSQKTKDAKAAAKAKKTAIEQEIAQKIGYEKFITKAALDMDRIARNTA